MFCYAHFSEILLLPSKAQQKVVLQALNYGLNSTEAANAVFAI